MQKFLFEIINYGKIKYELENINIIDNLKIKFIFGKIEKIVKIFPFKFLMG